ncbi:hypothetical protein ACRAWC_21960 [Leifsonia sp. L25]|uniref:hypothetical protein n=1 Tax=Leifsonia sp. L25 TaxID=3423957 RepID=UPI003D68C97D
MSSQTAAATAAPKPIMSHREILLVIFGLMAGMFLSALDQTVVGTAIRTIGDDLHGLSEQAWVTTGYLILSTISTPIYGKLSDISAAGRCSSSRSSSSSSAPSSRRSRPRCSSSRRSGPSRASAPVV